MGNEEQINLPDIIRNRKILPIEIKNRIINHVFFNCMIFMVILIITLIINVSFNQFTIRGFDQYIDIIQVFCAIISLCVLEIAYQKDSGRIGIYGIELLLFSIAVLFVPYMYIEKGSITFLRNVITVLSVYYVIKSLGTLFYIRNHYLRENISDIKELVKEEKEGYIDEVSTKSLKQQKIESEQRKKAREEKLRKKAEKKKSGGKKND